MAARGRRLLGERRSRLRRATGVCCPVESIFSGSTFEESQRRSEALRLDLPKNPARYRMLTGDRPFHGDSNVDMISSILRDRPSPVTEIRPDLPPHLARILRRCLEKEPRDRYQTSRDVYNELKELRQEASLTTTVAPPRHRSETTSPALAASGGSARGGIRGDRGPPFEDLSPAKDQEYLCEDGRRDHERSRPGPRHPRRVPD
jgi:serine/threonine protein kinase